jgi:hypothetical protein
MAITDQKPRTSRGFNFSIPNSRLDVPKGLQSGYAVLNLGLKSLYFEIAKAQSKLPKVSLVWKFARSPEHIQSLLPEEGRLRTTISIRRHGCP